jgi:hypothetical protein
MKRKKPTRQTGETNSQKAHKEYLAYIYADRSPKDFDKAKQSLKTNLQFGRRWSILVEGFVDKGDVVPGLGLGALELYILIFGCLLLVLRISYSLPYHLPPYCPPPMCFPLCLLALRSTQ